MTATCFATAVAVIRERQIECAEARSHSAPRRQGQVGHMFKIGWSRVRPSPPPPGSSLGADFLRQWDAV